MAKAKYWKLPGGRYGGITARGKRFIVDSLAKAKAKLGKRRKSKRTRTSNPKKKVKRRMARKKKRKGGKSMTRTAFKMIRLGCLIGGGLGEASQYISMQDKIIGGLVGYGGYHWGQKRFDGGVLARVWLPYLGSVLTTYGIPKLAQIIRRL